MVRADGDRDIGYGHVVRCGSLAGAWRRGGGAVTVVSASLDDLAVRFLPLGTELRMISAVPGSVADLEQTIRELGSSTTLALDGYAFDYGYQQGCAEVCQTLLVVDDGPSERYACTHLLDQNFAPDAATYRACAPGTDLMLGPAFSLLRPSIRDARARSDGRSKRVLVTVGGGDHDELALALVRGACRVAESVGWGVDMLLPSGDAAVAAAAPPSAVVHARIDDPSGLMSACGLAVSAAGSTVLELACIGIPSVLVPLVEHQHALAEAAVSAGVGVSSMDANVDAAVSLLERLLDDEALRVRMRAAGRTTVDGTGADLVAQRLSEHRRTVN